MLHPIDWIVMLVYLGFVVAIGFMLKRHMKTSTDFFLSGRALPAWVCGLAFISANLGALPSVRAVRAQSSILRARRNPRSRAASPACSISASVAGGITMPGTSLFSRKACL